MTAFKGFFETAREKAREKTQNIKISEDVKAKLTNVQTTVSTGVTTVGAGVS